MPLCTSAPLHSLALPDGWARLRPSHFAGWELVWNRKLSKSFHCYLGWEFLWRFFFMRSVLKKHGLSVFLCSSLSSLFSLWHCVEQSSCCDDVPDNVWMRGGWVRHDRGAEVTWLAQLTWWVNLSTAADAPSPLHTFPTLGHALLGQSLQPLVLLISVSGLLWLRAHKSWQAGWTQ